MALVVSSWGIAHCNATGNCTLGRDRKPIPPLSPPHRNRRYVAALKTTKGAQGIIKTFFNKGILKAMMDKVLPATPTNSIRKILKREAFNLILGVWARLNSLSASRLLRKRLQRKASANKRKVNDKCKLPANNETELDDAAESVGCPETPSSRTHSVASSIKKHRTQKGIDLLNSILIP